MGALTTRGGTVWFTGLSGAGKSTIAQSLQDLLGERGLVAYLLDGNDLREGLNSDLGYNEGGRTENVRRLCEVALLLARLGHLSIVSAISPYAAARSAVRQRHLAGGVPFLEVYVATPLEVCEVRDPKGLYAAGAPRRVDHVHGDLPPLRGARVPRARADDRGQPRASGASGACRLGSGRTCQLIPPAPPTPRSFFADRCACLHPTGATPEAVG